MFVVPYKTETWVNLERKDTKDGIEVLKEMTTVAGGVMAHLKWNYESRFSFDSVITFGSYWSRGR